MSIVNKNVEAGSAVVPIGAAGAAPLLASSPRANLMPPELAENKRKRSVRRSLRVLIVLVALIAIGAVGGSFYLAGVAQAGLASEQRITSDRQSQLAKLGGVKNTQAWIEQIEAAKRVGGSTDVDWSAFITDLQNHLPSGVALTGIAIDSADATTPVEQSEIPLENERIGTVTITAETSQLPSLPDWIQSLSSLQGFADATPGSLKFDDSTGIYTASVEMHINKDVYSHRFAKEQKK